MDLIYLKEYVGHQRAVAIVAERGAQHLVEQFRYFLKS
jgi:hypothetical protein